MKNLAAKQTEDADLDRSDVCLGSLTPLAGNARQAGRSDDVASNSGSASKNALVSLRSNVHQNVHQRIKKDRIGYFRIRLDFCCKCLIIRILHSDSDPRLRI